ncbi:MAG: hypothetical protein HQK55_14220, partial [Deltaproteobacteria bacterium]|nr:hypothetical protein [Deltaproteobacteria bacterium]
IASFETGGFVMDSGRKTDGKAFSAMPPPIVFRHDFPADWCFVIVIPGMEKGLFGRTEDEVMSCLNPSKKISEEICRLTHMKLLPALIEKNIYDFGESLTEIDLKTGMFFEKAQGGLYQGGELAHEIVESFLQNGAYGAGQSSWGPAIYGLTDKDNAQILATRMEGFLVQKNTKGKVLISLADNHGANIIVEV